MTTREKVIDVAVGSLEHLDPVGAPTALSCKFCGDPLPEGAEPGSACGREPRLLRRFPDLGEVGSVCLMWSALGYPYYGVTIAPRVSA